MQATKQKLFKQEKVMGWSATLVLLLFHHNGVRVWIGRQSRIQRKMHFVPNQFNTIQNGDQPHSSASPHLRWNLELTPAHSTSNIICAIILRHHDEAKLTNYRFTSLNKH